MNQTSLPLPEYNRINTYTYKQFAQVQLNIHKCRLALIINIHIMRENKETDIQTVQAPTTYTQSYTQATCQAQPDSYTSWQKTQKSRHSNRSGPDYIYIHTNMHYVYFAVIQANVITYGMQDCVGCIFCFYWIAKLKCQAAPFILFPIGSLCSCAPK